MRTRTLAVLAVVVLSLTGIVVTGVALRSESTTTMTVSWVSDTGGDVAGNHHAVAAGRVDGQGMVYAPISGRRNTETCELVALNAGNGERQWAYPVPPTNCTIHAVADPALADYDADGTTEVLAATTENHLLATDPTSGAVEATSDLTSYGYTRPVVTDLLGDDTPETIVVDVSGTVSVLRADGTTIWNRRLDAATWGQPAVADIDGDGRPELVVGTGGSGELHGFESDGTPTWDAPPTFESSITWMTTGQAGADRGAEIVVATARTGVVAMVDGNGQIRWSRDFGSLAAVHTMTDGDDDGTTEVYAVAQDGVVRSLNATTGDTEWETTLTTEDVQMTPPPVAGDVDGDGETELLTVTNNGIVSLLDPRSGEVQATYERPDTIYTHPTLADTDGDGDMEAFVMYGRGRVVAFDF